MTYILLIYIFRESKENLGIFYHRTLDIWYHDDLSTVLFQRSKLGLCGTGAVGVRNIGIALRRADLMAGCRALLDPLLTDWINLNLQVSPTEPNINRDIPVYPDSDLFQKPF